MKQKYIELLQNFDLSEKEANTYLTLLELGSSTVLEISRASQLKRSTIYPLLESLNRKGLVKIIPLGLKRKFAAINPEQLQVIWQQKVSHMQTALDGLQHIYSQGDNQSNIELYEGLPSVKTCYEKILREVQTGDKYYVIANHEEWINADYDYFIDFITRRAKRQITIQLLLTDSSIARRHKTQQARYNEEIKILPPHITLQTNMVVTPQNLLIHQLAKPIKSVLIHNKYMIQMQMQLFRLLWESMKP